MDDELEASVEKILLIPTALGVNLGTVGRLPVHRDRLVGHHCLKSWHRCAVYLDVQTGHPITLCFMYLQINFAQTRNTCG